MARKRVGRFLCPALAVVFALVLVFLSVATQAVRATRDAERRSEEVRRTRTAELSELKRLAEERWAEENEAYRAALRAAARPAAAYAVYVGGDGAETTLVARGEEKRLPVASITKMMTALVVVRHLSPEKVILISKDAVLQPQEAGKLIVGEYLSPRELLYPLLMESSNDAAYAFAESIGFSEFVRRMNGEAERLGMTETYFTNPAGFDTEDAAGRAPVSTARDLVRLARVLVEEYPELIAIMGTERREVRSPEGKPHHTAFNTNGLLREQGLPLEIVGGKTGLTPQAGECLLLVVRDPERGGYIVAVVLGSGDRLAEMKKLIEEASGALNRAEAAAESRAGVM